MATIPTGARLPTPRPLPIPPVKKAAAKKPAVKKAAAKKPAAKAAPAKKIVPPAKKAAAKTVPPPLKPVPPPVPPPVAPPITPTAGPWYKTITGKAAAIAGSVVAGLTTLVAGAYIGLSRLPDTYEFGSENGIIKYSVPHDAQDSLAQTIFYLERIREERVLEDGNVLYHLFSDADTNEDLEISDDEISVYKALFKEAAKKSKEEREAQRDKEIIFGSGSSTLTYTIKADAKESLNNVLANLEIIRGKKVLPDGNVLFTLLQEVDEDSDYTIEKGDLEKHEKLFRDEVRRRTLEGLAGSATPSSPTSTPSATTQNQRTDPNTTPAPAPGTPTSTPATTGAATSTLAIPTVQTLPATATSATSATTTVTTSTPAFIGTFGEPDAFPDDWEIVEDELPVGLLIDFNIKDYAQALAQYAKNGTWNISEDLQAVFHDAHNDLEFSIGAHRFDPNDAQKAYTKEFFGRIIKLDPESPDFVDNLQMLIAEASNEYNARDTSQELDPTLTAIAAAHLGFRSYELLNSDQGAQAIAKQAKEMQKALEDVKTLVEDYQRKKEELHEKRKRLRRSPVEPAPARILNPFVEKLSPVDNTKYVEFDRKTFLDAIIQYADEGNVVFSQKALTYLNDDDGRFKYEGKEVVPGPRHERVYNELEQTLEGLDQEEPGFEDKLIRAIDKAAKEIYGKPPGGDWIEMVRTKERALLGVGRIVYQHFKSKREPSPAPTAAEPRQGYTEPASAPRIPAPHNAPGLPSGANK